MEYFTTTSKASRRAVDCVIVGVYERNRLGVGAEDVDAASKGEIKRRVKSGDISSSIGRCCILTNVPGVKADRVAVVGLGKSSIDRILQLIADEGPAAFYEGAIADKIVAAMEAGGGLIDKASLAAYRPIVRDAISSNYRGYEVVTMPPPSSGGVHVLQMLNVLENFPVADMGAGSVRSLHVMAETMKRLSWFACHVSLPKNLSEFSTRSLIIVAPR